MKILYITYDGLNDTLGRSQVLPYLNRLNGSGVEYTVLSFEKRLPLPEGICARGINLVTLKYHKRPAILSTAYDILVGLTKGLLIVKKDKIGIAHARGYVPAIIALMLKRFLKIKFVFDMRGFWANERAEAGLWKKNGLIYKIAKRFEKTFFMEADHIVSLTESGKREIEGLEYMRSRRLGITVIPTCVDLDKFKPNKSREEGRISFIYVGSLSTWYMPSEMVDFVKVARTIDPRWQLTFLTREKAYAQMLLKNRDADFVKVASSTYEEVPRYLASCNVGLAFYKTGYSRKGCCPTKLGEYLACGLPIVINSGIGDSDRIIEGERVGVVISGFSEGEYKAAIQKLNALLSEGEALALRCRRAAEKYLSLEEGVKRFYNVYEGL